MGEAKRKKLVGNNSPNPKYRRAKKITRRNEQEIMMQSMMAMLPGLLLRKPRLPL